VTIHILDTCPAAQTPKKNLLLGTVHRLFNHRNLFLSSANEIRAWLAPSSFSRDRQGTDIRGGIPYHQLAFYESIVSCWRGGSDLTCEVRHLLSAPRGINGLSENVPFWLPVFRALPCSTTLIYYSTYVAPFSAKSVYLLASADWMGRKLCFPSAYLAFPFAGSEAET